MDRRDFLKTTAAGAAGMWLGGGALAGQAGRRTRYAIVGTGGRHSMYRDAILKTYPSTSELVALCDVNEGRLRLSQAKGQAMAGVRVPYYLAADFDRMIAESKPDIVIVTTVDVFHHQYIIRAMELGCDVMTEKPLTNGDEKVRAIQDALKRTGRKCRVTFNYRYSPPRTQVKDLLMAGVIGDILSVDFHWLLNTSHGTDYFRRWHSQKKFSNGLMCHKATHHFDLVNWWLSAIPVSVFGTGKREFYTPAMARRIGLSGPHERCHTCPEKDRCAFELSLAKNAGLKELYLDCESYDGYFRDKCVFRSEIDIEDTMNVLVKYDSGATLCYSVNAFNAWEGYTIAFNGTKGRLEHKAEESVYLTGDGSVPGALKPDGTTIRIYPLREPAYGIDVWTGEGGHGGGDDVMLEEIFGPEKKRDKYMRAADHRSGAYSCLVGIAANLSFKSGQPVEVAGLAPGLGYPDYPAMPAHIDLLPMPKKI